MLAFLLALALAGCGGGPSAPDASDSSTGGCPPGTEECGGACVDVRGDPANCGGCGNACENGEACVEGECSLVCPSSQQLCGTTCVDLDSDVRHCGACDDPCGAGELCVGGSCQVSCPEGQTVCDGACADTDSDPRHCGGCGAACPAGLVCNAGACASECSAGLTECGGACVDLDHDPGHCGGCDTSCDPATGATGICEAGACRRICGPLLGDCNGDLQAAGGDGCETSLATDPMNCGACALACAMPNAVPGCVDGACTIAACIAGFADCDSDASNGCELDVREDESNCGGCGVTCGASELCVGGSCEPLVAESCADAVALSVGANSIAWTAGSNDYLTTDPSCVPATADVVGPDIVLSYTATGNEYVTLELPDEPISTTWVAVVSTAACGTVVEHACFVEGASPGLTGSFRLSAGETAYVYVADTDRGAAPLARPLVVNVSTLDCATAPAPAVVALDPPDGAVSSSLSPVFTVTFDAPVDTSTGVITITRSEGAPLTYDLSTSPAAVTFSSGDTVMRIDPGMELVASEELSIGWTGLRGLACLHPVAAPAWNVEVYTPPCVPGRNGMVGTTVTRMPGPASTTEYFVAADDEPSGWVYVGSTTELWRVPKAGGAVEDVEAAASLASTNLGYAMQIAGSSVFVIDDKSTGTAGRVFRITTDGGATWMVEDFVTFPSTPGDFRASTLYEDRVYLVTHDTGGAAIWSFDPYATTVPTMATLELTVTGGGSCSGLARDDAYYYLACSTGNAVYRVPIAGGAPEAIMTSSSMSATVNSLIGHDLDGDGIHDVLYLHGQYERVEHVCSPSAPLPLFSRELANHGTASANYGMGFDPSTGTLWLFDDDTDELVSIQ